MSVDKSKITETKCSSCSTSMTESTETNNNDLLKFEKKCTSSLYLHFEKVLRFVAAISSSLFHWGLIFVLPGLAIAHTLSVEGVISVYSFQLTGAIFFSTILITCLTNYVIMAIVWLCDNLDCDKISK